MKFHFEKIENCGLCEVRLVGKKALIIIEPSLFQKAAEDNNLKRLLHEISKVTKKYSSYLRILGLTLRQFLMTTDKDFPHKEAGFEKLYVNNDDLSPEEFESLCKELESKLGMSLEIPMEESQV